MKQYNFYANVILVSFFLFAITIAAEASTTNWIDGAGDDLWSSPLNWTSGVLPPGNDLVFTNTGASPTSGVVTSIVDDAYTINSLTFNNTSYHYLQFQPGTSLNTQSITLNNGGSVSFDGSDANIRIGNSYIKNGILNIYSDINFEVTSSLYIGLGQDSTNTGILNLAPGAGLKVGSASTPIPMYLGYKYGNLGGTVTGTFAPDSSLNPDMELHLSSLYAGYGQDQGGSGVGTLNLTNYTGQFSISNTLNVGSANRSIGHVTFGNDVLNTLSVPNINIYNGDLNINSDATLEVTSSLYIGLGQDSTNTGILNLAPGAGLKVGSASTPIPMYLGYKYGNLGGTVTGTFAPDSSLNPDMELHLSSLYAGYGQDQGGSGVGTLNLTNYTGQFSISNTLNVGSANRSIGHVTFGNDVLNTLSVPNVNIYNGDLNINSDATLEVTSSLYIGLGQDSTNTGILNLAPGAGLKVGSASTPIPMYLGYKYGNLGGTVTGTFAPDSSLNPDMELHLSSLYAGYGQDQGGTGVGTLNLTNYTGQFSISNTLNVGSAHNSIGHVTFGNDVLNNLSIPNINIYNGDLNINTESIIEIVNNINVGSNGKVNVDIDGFASGLSIENEAVSALSLSSGTGRINLIFGEQDQNSSIYWGLRWKGDHVSLLSSWFSGGNYFGDGRITALLSAGLNPSDLLIGLSEWSGTQYTYIGFEGITTIPAPAAIVLGGLGAVMVGWLRKRKTI